MNRTLIESMDSDALGHKLKELNQSQRLREMWAAVAGCSDGHSLIAEMRKRIDLIRQGYSKLPVNSQYAPVFLAGLQAKEQEACEMLMMLESAVEHKKAIDEEASVVLECMTKLQEGQREPARSIVAQAAISENMGDTNDR